jgi:hypothetical protein
MHKIHELSGVTTLPEFDIFTVPPTQLTIDKNIVTEHRPIAPISDNNTKDIEIYVNSGVDEYILLRETLFSLKLKVTIKKKTGTLAEADWKKIQPVNNLLHSIFKNIDLEIEGRSLCKSENTYPYKAYLENFLGFSETTKAGFLSSVGWYDELKKNDINEDQAKLIEPKTFNTNGIGKSINLLGKLNLDLAFQPRALIGGTRLKFTLTPNKPDFYLWNQDDTLTADVTFEDATLYITKAKVNPLVVEAHNLAINKGTAKYPVMRGYVRTFTINSGVLDHTIDNAISGQIPRRVFLALVDHESSNGVLKSNPFKFEQKNLNYLSISVDGIQYPANAYTPDFSNDKYTREYIGLYDALNQLSTDSTLPLSYAEYKAGNTIYGFNLAPDPIDDCNKMGYVNPTKIGTMRINLKFSSALVKNTTVILYCEYDNVIEINSARQAILDY